MNAMSVSPVKPSINPGNHAVPATATNLSKNPLPPSNNFTPINSIPENKPVPAVIAAPTNVENSVDLCLKPPTSNGTVSPTPEAKSRPSPAGTQQNHTDSCETAENLSTTDNPPPKTNEVVAEAPKTVEESKSTETKDVTPPKGNSEPVKEAAKEPIKEVIKEPLKEAVKEPAPAQVEPVKEAPKTEESSAKEEKKEETVVNNAKEISPPKQPEASPVKATSEPIEEPKKEEAPAPELAKEVKEEKEPPVKDSPEKESKKSEAKTEPPAESTPIPAKTTKRKAKPPVEPVEEDNGEGRKSKRVRLPTQPYQSPIPELQFIAKLQTPAKTTPKPPTEKIIAFYKNEFLAVRNPEGSFYICQTFQNIHKSSTKIKIRWFTNLPQDIFTPDFCDTTEFDCILTNVQMTRVEKDRWKLPDFERTRIENILKRALDLEKGVVDTPSITEEHPDGLDLSLFKDEAQLKKKKKKKSTSPKAKKDTEAKKQTPKPTKPPKTPVASTKKSARLSNLNQTPAKEVEKVKPAESKTKKGKKEKKGSKKSPSTNKQNDKTSAKVWEPSVKSSSSSRVVLSLKKENVSKPETKTTTKRTSNVSSRAASASNSSPPVPQKRRKEEPKPAAASQPATTSERTGKVRNAGSAVTAKINSAAMRTTKDKERKVSNSSNQRKK